MSIDSRLREQERFWAGFSTGALVTGLGILVAQILAAVLL